MRCRQAQRLISLALDEPLSEYDRSHLGQHLESCDACVHHRAVLLRGRELLSDGLAEPPENFEWKVQLGIQRALRAGAAAAELPVPRRRFWLPVASSAAAVASVVIVAGALWLKGEADVPSGTGAARQLAANATSPALNLRDAQRTELPVVPVYARPGFGVQEASSRYRPTQGSPLQRFVDDTDPSVAFFHVGSHALWRELEWLRAENARLRHMIEAGHSPTGALPPDSARVEPSRTQPR